MRMWSYLNEASANNHGSYVDNKYANDLTLAIVVAFTNPMLTIYSFNLLNQ